MALYTTMSKKSQAEHNEKACKHLHSSKEFHDWVITTAFYSSIHYIDGCLFPASYEMTNGKIKNCGSIDDYFSKNNQAETKHIIRMYLVEEFCIEIQAQFKWLMDNSSHLRYSDYKTTEEEANKAIEYLDEIKQFFKENQK